MEFLDIGDSTLSNTWVALALARDALRHAAEPPLVVAPAALRRMWRDAAATAGLPIAFCSTESLSAPSAPPLPTRPPLVVVDEAHHFRTPATRRRERLTAACAHAPTLLLSATPVHNTARDLASLLALFLGDRAHALDAATLAHLVVRRRHADVRSPLPAESDAPAPDLPRVARARWHRLPAAPAVRRALLALPPPLPAADGAPAPALATLTLVRLWASSDAALRAALRRRLVRTAALAHALAAGRHPDRRTLARWAAHDDALQLPLFLDGAAPPNASALAAHVDAYAAALRRTLAVLDTAPPADPARVAWLRTVRDAHAGTPIVAFTQFADTARALFRALAPDGHVGLLTAAGGRLASGPLPRDALLARFAAPNHDGPAAAAIERVDLLVTTDCLSEGLDLRAAAAVVHLDVPWTPARLAQRVGRAARLGAPHPCVHVYGLGPDPPTDRWLRLARRLRTKARAARRALGISPRRARWRARDARAPARRGTHGATATASATARDELPRHAAVHRLCERWLAAAPTAAAPNSVPPVLAAVRCGRAGFVAVCAPPEPGPLGARPPALVASLAGRPPTAAPRAVARALRRLARPDACAAPAPPALAAAARRAVRAWARRQAAAAAVGVTARPVFDPAIDPAIHATTRAVTRATTRATTTTPSSGTVRVALARADAALRTAPPHARAARAAAVARLRDALTRPLSAGAERALAAVAHLAGDDVWLLAAGAALAPAAAPAKAAPKAAPDLAPNVAPAPRITALVLLLP